MAKDQAFTDEKTIRALDEQLSRALANFGIHFKQLKEYKEEALGDPERKAAMKVLIDLREGWSMTKITTKYNKYKKVYDFLIEEGFITGEEE